MKLKDLLNEKCFSPKQHAATAITLKKKKTKDLIAMIDEPNPSEDEPNPKPKIEKILKKRGVSV